MEDKLDIIIKELQRNNELLQQLVDQNKYDHRPRWDDEQETLLKELYHKGSDIPSIISAIRLSFGIERSTGAIESRLRLLGLIDKPKKKFKTGVDEDDKPIMDRIYDDPHFKEIKCTEENGLI